VSDDATKDLRGIVDKVDNNMAIKEQLRKVQGKLALYKEAVRNGESYVAHEHKTEMQELLTSAGLTANNSAEGELIKSLPTGAADTIGKSGGGLSQLSNERRAELGIPANAVAFETAAGYVMVFDDVGGNRRGKGESMQIFGPDNKNLTQVWGDPHVYEGDGSKWDFTEDGDMILGDGTLIKMDTTHEPGSGSHRSYLDTVTIVSGDDRVEVSDIHRNRAQATTITQDGEQWRANHMAEVAQAEGYSQFVMAEEGGNIKFYALVDGTEKGIVSGSNYDSTDNVWAQTYQSTQEERDKALSGVIKSFETMLDHRAQSLSDLGQKLQFQLQEKNNIYTRSNKSMSDIRSKYDQNFNGVANNLKG
ncbi:MAG: DUF1521 domain-containing protein, partial [Myxococcota bacterium]